MTKRLLFGVVVASQLAYLGAAIGYHQARIHTGTKILLKTAPVDPLSIFRGRYLALSYDISRIPAGAPHDVEVSDLKTDDTVYVVLVKGHMFWEPVSVHTHKPSKGTFLRGRLRYRSGDELWIVYGIESFFLSETSADDIERNIREASRTAGRRDVPLTVEVAVASDGTGYPVTLLWQGRAYR